MGVMSTIKARNQFSSYIKRASKDKERIILTSRGKEVAAIVPIEDAIFLEELEDRIDNEECDKILAETKPEDWIPWETVKKEIGL